jgi:hypothetical protein
MDALLACRWQVLRYETGQAYIAHHDYFPVQQSEDHNWDPSKGPLERAVRKSR